MSKTAAKGKPVMITPVCKASRPPLNKSAMAIPPCIKDQKTLCQTGEFSKLPKVILSTTNEPESDEVTKKEKTSNTASRLENWLSGKFSKNTNKEEVISSCTAVSISVSPPIILSRALPPKTFIQRIEISAGTTRTPKTNSLMVLPFDIRAIKEPTKGDHAIHQPQ